MKILHNDQCGKITLEYNDLGHMELINRDAYQNETLGMVWHLEVLPTILLVKYLAVNMSEWSHYKQDSRGVFITNKTYANIWVAFQDV